MSGLTKEQLKNELITHGVELPSPSARKDEYVRLYDKYVAPILDTKGEFSSDDDELPVVVTQERSTKVNMNQSLVVDGLDITKLDDDELFSRLQDLGAVAGPIVDSTRKVYQRKLMVLMGGDVVDSPFHNGDVDEEEEYSDSEEVQERVEESVDIHYVKPSTFSPPPSQMSDIRKRVLLSSAGESPQVEDQLDEDRFTPSPRRSLRSVTSSSYETTTTTYRNSVNNGRSGTLNTSAAVLSREEEEEQDKKSKVSLIVWLVVKLLFLALIIALILYIYQNDPNESPFKAVEQLARQALEAAVGEEAGVEKNAAPGSSPPPPKETPVH